MRRPNHNRSLTARVLSAIEAERLRQVVKGYDAAHDDGHCQSEIAHASACYALMGTGVNLKEWMIDVVERLWPWSGAKPMPESQRETLIVAAALLVAEIERLDRAKSRQP